MHSQTREITDSCQVHLLKIVSFEKWGCAVDMVEELQLSELHVFPVEHRPQTMHGWFDGTTQRSIAECCTAAAACQTFAELCHTQME